MIAFWKRECRSYFHSATGYVFIAGMLAVIGISAYLYCVAGRMPAYEKALDSAALIFLLMVPVLTMRLFSDDRRDKVLDFLYTLPIRLSDMVLGKYFALITILAVPLVITFFYPLILSRWGKLSFGMIAGTYAGLFLMGSALLAIGLFVSALIENQVAASAVTFVLLLTGYFMPSFSNAVPNSAFAGYILLCALFLAGAGLYFLLSRNSVEALLIAIAAVFPLCAVYIKKPELLEGVPSRLFDGLSFYARFSYFSEGIFDITTVCYYLSIVFLMLFLTVEVLEARRYR